MLVQYQLFEQLELQIRYHIPTRFGSYKKGFLHQKIETNDQHLKNLPFLQKVLQSWQYFGCEEIEYDHLHWLHINRKSERDTNYIQVIVIEEGA